LTYGIEEVEYIQHSIIYTSKVAVWGTVPVKAGLSLLLCLERCGLVANCFGVAYGVNTQR